ncbi:class I SAM-dependent methyltransferase [Micromonospora sp. DR5-3]|uniref:class I SAM-dependent methyltransferase n=1 Tax=unclassified Micromonospora TaxID=2617518 RepID=UPI0011D9C6C1|nr:MULTISPECIES: class I SAM-dependent methyltransferase [unclassified Micromonospora]MCW3812943.1 class I SAM-dependent methyltransferase [Micromonospora sp. DR5-3]TYC26057.1 class I SAM-dependent methyltransferase [Micromonospora sp. MP36]
MRHRPLGVVTRGTTNPNRLRRVDNWIVKTCGEALRSAADPLVVDLGYGATPVTAVELRARLAAGVRADVRVVGLEIDPVRVAAAQPAADPPGLTFARGGFELAGLRPALVRAFNVLRQYDESEVADAWRTVTERLAPGGLLIEGTCDELGRLGGWVLLDAAGPRTLTLAAKLTTLESPAQLAERLPKALIHRNVPGERIHDLIRALDEAWQAAAGYAPFGPRQRWLRTVAAVEEAGWPVLDRPRRWRHGELTVPWPTISPT